MQGQGITPSMVQNAITNGQTRVLTERALAAIEALVHKRLASNLAGDGS
jgi:hypothetical protein